MHIRLPDHILDAPNCIRNTKTFFHTTSMKEGYEVYVLDNIDRSFPGDPILQNLVFKNLMRNCFVFLLNIYLLFYEGCFEVKGYIQFENNILQYFNYENLAKEYLRFKDRFKKDAIRFFLYELSFFEYPITELLNLYTLYRIINKCGPLLMLTPRNEAEVLYGVDLNKDPNLRCTMTDILNNSWIKRCRDASQSRIPWKEVVGEGERLKQRQAAQSRIPAMQQRSASKPPPFPRSGIGGGMGSAFRPYTKP